MHNSSLNINQTAATRGDSKLGLDDSTDSEAGPEEDEDAIILKKAEEFKPVPNNMGLYYKVRLFYHEISKFTWQ